MPKTHQKAAKDLLAMFDTNGDGIVSEEDLVKLEKILELESKRAQEQDRDRKEDAQRNMSWFALFGMLLYPVAVMLSDFLGLESAASILGTMAPTYFVAVAAIVAAFYGKEAYLSRNKNE
jgi:hypothetical protein